MLAATIVVTMIVLLVTGCSPGAKDADGVVKELKAFMKDMQGYEAQGTMTIKTGETPLVYEVSATYLQPHYYKIELNNQERAIKQVILRNDEGVFVLTPSMNKVFKFQSDWPQNQGQVYLFQTLAQSIMNDNTRTFKAEKDAYVFEVMANYQNSSLSRQTIWLSKQDFHPMKVAVSDQNGAVMVEVQFTKFTYKNDLKKSLFATDANMSPTETPSQSTFVPMEPTYLPEGVAFKDSEQITFGGAPGTLLRYAGNEVQFTLMQTKPHDVATSMGGAGGDLIDLGYTLAELTGNEENGLRAMTWTYEGIQFRLASTSLPEVEMVRVAQSVLAEMTK